MIRRSDRLVLGILATLTIVQLARADDVPTKPVDGSIAWVYNYDEAKQIARDAGKPMFVVFRCER